MTRDEFLRRAERICTEVGYMGDNDQPDVCHWALDELMVEYINDEFFTQMWKAQERWYS